MCKAMTIGHLPTAGKSLHLINIGSYI
jgi:hypothetical protein